VFSPPAGELGSVPFGSDDRDVVVQREAVRAEGTTGSAPAAVPGPQPVGDLDLLARQLYGRLRTMLKHELSFDRERAGLWTQVRR
jgi:hypothetical protein